MKRLSKNHKGDILEYLVKHLLEKIGYDVYTVQRTMTRIGPNQFISRSVDVWGCDLICRHPARKMSFIQVTGMKASNDKRKVTESEFWNHGVTDVLYYRFRHRARETNDFLISQYFGEAVWIDTDEIPVSMEIFFEPVDKFIRKKNISVISMCEYLGWLKPEFVAMRKARK